MTDEHGTEHEDVISSLLDLQRRLRDDGSKLGEASTPVPDPSAPPATTITRDPRPADPDAVAVSEPDLSVLMTPRGPSEPERDRFAPVTQLPTSAAPDGRVSALADRLARLEDDLSGMMGSIEAVGRDGRDGRVDVESRVTALQAELAARIERLQAESEARLQRSVAERMYAVESRLVGELREQRDRLAGLIGQRFEGMDATLRKAIREAADGSGVDDAPASPAAGDAGTD
jgi:hypothetical protein